MVITRGEKEPRSLSKNNIKILRSKKKSRIEYPSQVKYRNISANVLLESKIIHYATEKRIIRHRSQKGWDAVQHKKNNVIIR